MSRQPRRATRPATAPVTPEHERAADGIAWGSTTDDTDAGWGEGSDEEARLSWLRAQRPPHWGTDVSD